MEEENTLNEIEISKELEKSTIEELKEDYEKARQTYNLPTFENLNLNFQIEKICDVETDFLLLEIRKQISEKLSNYLKLIETLINPVSAQMIVYHIVKTLTPKNQETLRELYKKLAKLEIKVVELDIDFDEEKEARFIRKAYDEWQTIKKDLLEITETIQENWDTKTETNDKHYFG